MSLAPGTKLGRYEIRSKIGQGGMGEVYLAEDTQLGRKVAIADLKKRSPTDTVLNNILLPLIQARSEFQKGNAAEAIQLLEATRSYEGYALFQIAYLRGQAYLNLRKGSEAIAEFQKILDLRGSQPTSPIYSLAQLGLARAARLNNDAAKTRKGYEAFFALWRDADHEITILQEARRESEQLK